MASMVFGALGSSLLGPLGGFLGSALGSSIDNMLFASFGPNQEGPRIENLNVVRADPGVAIPLVYGADRVPGIIAASTKLIETKHKQRMGKGGGGKVITYTYHVTIDYMLSEGPILGVARIWTEGNLIRGTRYEMETSTAEYPEHIGGIPYPDYYRDHLYDPKLIPWSLDHTKQPMLSNWDGKFYTTTADRLAMYEISEEVAEAFLNMPDGRATQLPPFFQGLMDLVTKLFGSLRNNSLDSKPIVYWRDTSTGYYIPLHEDHAFKKSLKPKLNNPRAMEKPVGTAVFASGGSGYGTPLLVDLTQYIDAVSLANIEISGRIMVTDGFSAVGNEESFGVDVTSRVLNIVFSFYADGNNYTVDGDEVGAPLGGDYIQHWLLGKEARFGGGVSIPAGTRFIKIVPDHALFFPVFAGSHTGYAQMAATYTMLRGNVDNRIRDWPDYWNLYDAINDWSSRAVLAFEGPANLTLYHGTMNQEYDVAMESAMQGEFLDGEDMGYPAYIGRAHIVFDTLQLEDFGNRVPNFSFEVVQYDDVRIAMVLVDLMTRATVDEKYYDIAELPSVGQSSHILGYSVQNKMTYRAAMETVIEAFRVDAAEIGNQLVFRPRDRAYEWTVDYMDLAAMEPNGTVDDILKFTYRDRMEMPRHLTVRFKDVERMYQANTALYSRQQTPSVQDSMSELAVVLPSGQAKAYARDKMRDLWLERVSLAVKLPHKYVYIAPSDIVFINGSEYGFRDISFKVTKAIRGANGVIEVEGVLREVKLYEPLPGEVTNTDMDGSTWRRPTFTSGSGDYTSTDVDGFIIDVPGLRPQDHGKPGFYVAFGGTDSFRGGHLFREVTETSYTEIISSPRRSITGDTREGLPFHMSELPDFEGEIIVDLHNETDDLESVTFEEITMGMNAALVGREIVQFMNAEKISGNRNRWRLWTLFRGRRGTYRPEILSGHSLVENFVLLSSDALVSVESVEVANPPYNRTYKAASPGQDLEEVLPFTVTHQEMRRLNLPAWLVHGVRNDANDDIDIRWLFQGGFSVPSISEDGVGTGFSMEEWGLFLNWTLTIYTTSMTVLRNVDQTYGEWAAGGNGWDHFNYTEAMQIADGHTPGAQIIVNVRPTTNAGYINYNHRV